MKEKTESKNNKKYEVGQVATATEPVIIDSESGEQLSVIDMIAELGNQIVELDQKIEQVRKQIS